jgi:hypothetical protein
MDHAVRCTSRSIPAEIPEDLIDGGERGKRSVRGRRAARTDERSEYGVHAVFGSSIRLIEYLQSHTPIVLDNFLKTMIQVD